MWLAVISAVLGTLAFPLAEIYLLGFVFLTPFLFFLLKNVVFYGFFRRFSFRFILGLERFFAFDPIIFISSILFFWVCRFPFLVKNITKFLVNKYFPVFMLANY